ncbi:1029_t:CDS:2, partial [Gigaspora margarita]
YTKNMFKKLQNTIIACLLTTDLWTGRNRQEYLETLKNTIAKWNLIRKIHSIT